jgi:hypothetical protein
LPASENLHINRHNGRFDGSYAACQGAYEGSISLRPLR